jgi:hypothetical protein
MQTPDPQTARRQYLETIQPGISEPVLALGFLSRADMVRDANRSSLKAHALFSVSPLLAMISGFSKKKDAPTTDPEAMPQLVAVTASSVYLFPYPQGAEFTAQHPPRVLARADLRATAGKAGQLAVPIHLELRSGQFLDFEHVESKRSPWAGFSDRMIELLLQPVAA